MGSGEEMGCWTRLSGEVGSSEMVMMTTSGEVEGGSSVEGIGGVGEEGTSEVGIRGVVCLDGVVFVRGSSEGGICVVF